jgi:hypothetical protein
MEHRDFCGPYISDGKWQSSVCGYATARSAEEQCCKDHDCAYHMGVTPQDFVQADREFVSCNAKIGSLQSKINSGLVSTFGKYFHSGPRSQQERRSMKRPFDWTCGYCDTKNYGAMEQCGVCDDPMYGDDELRTPPKVRRVTVPQAPTRSRKRLRLSEESKQSLKGNLLFYFNNNVDRLLKRRRFSRLPRSSRLRIAQEAKRRWRIAYAKKLRAKARNRYYKKRSYYASKLQRSFRKFLWRKKHRNNILKKTRYISSPSGLRRYIKW